MNLDDLASQIAAKLKEAIKEIEHESKPVSRSPMTESEIKLDQAYDEAADVCKETLLQMLKVAQAFRDESNKRIEALHTRLYDEIARRHGYASLESAHASGAKFGITEDQQVDLFLSTPASQKSASAAPSKN